MNRDLVDLLRSLGDDAPTARMRAKLREEIRAETRRARRLGTRRRWTLAAAAVVLLATAAVSGVRLWRSADPSLGLIEDLRSESALRRARAARSTADLPELPSALRAELNSLLLSDSDTNVRMAALYALTARAAPARSNEVLVLALEAERLPIVQAHLVRALTSESSLSPAELERLRALDHLDEAARRRLPES